MRGVTPEPSQAGEATPDLFTQQVVSGGDWILDRPDVVPSLWGNGSEIGWAKGQSLMIVAPSGVGKTTLAGQLLWGVLGLDRRPVLGLDVTPIDGKVLYLAMDRPEQIAAALKRLATEDQRETLNERLRVHVGPLAMDLVNHPELLKVMVATLDVQLVVMDSAKDAITRMSEDEAGGAFNRAVQMVLSLGCDVMVLHHQRKGVNGARPRTIEDVYGSSMITNGAGSIVLLWGAPGDTTLELLHLKMPANPIGPLRVEVDREAGRMTLPTAWDPMAFFAGQGGRAVTLVEATRGRTGIGEPGRSEREATRRILTRLVERGHLKVVKGGMGSEGREPDRWQSTGRTD